jgi:hypothetical protein
MTLLAEGNSLKDGSTVLAKIAPSQSNGSMCLEREAHMYVLYNRRESYLIVTFIRLERVASTGDGIGPALRVIEFVTIPRHSGDVVVLLLGHPGLNLLGRYLPPSKINDLILPDNSHPVASLTEDVNMADIDIPGQVEEDFDVMDLATFLE